MIADSHCHLDYSKLYVQLDKVIERATINKVKYLLTICTTLDSFNRIKIIIEKYKNIYGTFGIHPHECKNFTKIDYKYILDIKKKNSKIIGIGETGLDFYHSKEYKSEQYKSFENHIECSYDTNLPLIIHQRNSEKEIIDILNNYQKHKPLKIVFHCFTGSEKLKSFCLDNEFYISLSGIVTFKNAIDLRKVIHNFPLQQILIETDSPFLAPVPFRGKMNEPSYVKYISEYLSNFYNISQNKFNEISDNSFYKLFSKAIRYNEIS